ncbi:hypothetical protein DSCA_44070 [Desulfosarcina alkanivorans]|uniref:Uncharacterized protein n=1 Tax=Desulfosarcina alkanivorans TaxID=571177 RepID=A0A5K7Z0Z1_9BACT|nr:hypothetical protein [Desulfosarcina alkanivorans]BBO70477.1 hypothetical protein DSCA_44070 [Desulfosarcina alkanivorans]
MTLSRLKPAVPKCWLFAASGVMWSAVGLMMCLTGIGWLVPEGFVRGAGFELLGLLLAWLAVRRGFGGIARKNIRRLRRLPDRGCFFAFQAWKSYLLIMIMIALGIALRHSPVPPPFLAVVYTAVGGALFLASFHYYRHLVRLMRTLARRRAGRRPFS